MEGVLYWLNYERNVGFIEWYIIEIKIKLFFYLKEGFCFLKIDCIVRVVNVFGYG